MANLVSNFFLADANIALENNVKTALQNAQNKVDNLISQQSVAIQKSAEEAQASYKKSVAILISVGGGLF